MRYQCLVCLYPAMDEAPRNYAICPCCGTEFGLDDDGVSHAELRARWVENHCPWFSNYTRPPSEWNPASQLGVRSIASAPSKRSNFSSTSVFFGESTVRVSAR